MTVLCNDVKNYIKITKGDTPQTPRSDHQWWFMYLFQDRPFQSPKCWSYQHVHKRWSHTTDRFARTFSFKPQYIFDDLNARIQLMGTNVIWWTYCNLGRSGVESTKCAPVICCETRRNNVTASVDRARNERNLWRKKLYGYRCHGAHQPAKATKVLPNQQD